MGECTNEWTWECTKGVHSGVDYGEWARAWVVAVLNVATTRSSWSGPLPAFPPFFLPSFLPPSLLLLAPFSPLGRREGNGAERGWTWKWKWVGGVGRGGGVFQGATHCWCRAADPEE